MFRSSEHYGFGSNGDQDFGADEGPQEISVETQDGALHRPDERQEFEIGNIRQGDIHFAPCFQDMALEHRSDLRPMWHPSASFSMETPEQKKRRKNREAAARCQRRKKEQTEILRGDVEYLQHLVDQMKSGLPMTAASVAASSTASMAYMAPGRAAVQPMQAMLPPTQKVSTSQVTDHRGMM